MNDFNLKEVDRLLTTTKQVRKRLDLTRDVPTELLLECIEVAGHAPVGGNLERNRWIIVTDPELKAEIANYYGEVGRPYLAASADIRTDERTARVIDSSIHLIDHLHEVPAFVIPLRLDRPPAGETPKVPPGVGGVRFCPGCGASSWLPGLEVSDLLGQHSILHTKPRSLNFLAFHRP